MDKPKTSESLRRAIAKYNKSIGRVTLRMSNEKKAAVEDHIKETGESFNGFVNRAINETLTSDASKKKIDS